MHYPDLRSQIKSGDVLAWTHRSWDSIKDIQCQIVRMATQSEYSHVGVAWVVAERVFVLEAVTAGVRIFPLSRSAPFYWVPRGIWSDEAERRAMAHVGAEYSKWEAIKAFFGGSSYDNDAWECAEYVCWVLGLPVVAKTPAKVVQHLQDVEGLELRTVAP